MSKIGLLSNKFKYEHMQAKQIFHGLNIISLLHRHTEVIYPGAYNITWEVGNVSAMSPMSLGWLVFHDCPRNGQLFSVMYNTFGYRRIVSLPCKTMKREQPCYMVSWDSMITTTFLVFFYFDFHTSISQNRCVLQNIFLPYPLLSNTWMFSSCLTNMESTKHNL